MSATNSSVTMTYRPPAHTSPSTVVMYVIKYRKVGFHPWKFTRESTGLRQTVSGLEANTRYEFRVVARYEGESSTMESTSAIAETTTDITPKSKCALSIFPYSVSQVNSSCLAILIGKFVSFVFFTTRCCVWRGYDIACHLSVRLSVCPSVTLRYDFHTGWNKIISRRK